MELKNFKVLPTVPLLRSYKQWLISQAQRQKDNNLRNFFLLIEEARKLKKIDINYNLIILSHDLRIKKELLAFEYSYVSLRGNSFIKTQKLLLLKEYRFFLTWVKEDAFINSDTKETILKREFLPRYAKLTREKAYYQISRLFFLEKTKIFFDLNFFFYEHCNPFKKKLILDSDIKRRFFELYLLDIDTETLRSLFQLFLLYSLVKFNSR